MVDGGQDAAGDVVGEQEVVVPGTLTQEGRRGKGLNGMN